ncbi:MAG TPA: hypothetical protein VGW75_15895 [Solirubrobacteraceae bacterium]|nr:hypothetical protein [Solirubrobacteraceae bacterium]
MLGRRRLAVLAALAVLAGCGGDDPSPSADAKVAPAVADQLKYLDPRSSAVFAVDLRWEGRNVEHLRAIASRALRTYREHADEDVRSEIPPNVTGALNMLASFAGLSFDEDVRPLLDGYAVVGVTQPPVPPLPPEAQAIRRKPAERRTPEETNELLRAQGEQDEAAQPLVVTVYKTGGDGLRRVLEKVSEGERLAPVPGREDVLRLGDELFLIGDDTLLWVDATDRQALANAALDRAEGGAGYPAARLADAERAAALDDPWVLLAGDRTVARAWVDDPSLQRALREVPWLGAIRSLAGAMRLDERGADLAGVVSTDPRALRDGDLPLAPAGDLELPRNDLMTGASRDQSFTTTFLSRTARALFADSDFASAVGRAERDLGVRFEDEVLRQFSCPSMSQFDPAARRFGARSCVKDPERMRELLPKLSEHLPRILTTLQRLDTQGLVGLLLVAPDAPLTPSFSALADVVVKPFRGGGEGEEETLYEVTGLADDWTSELSASAPDKVVFGLVGDTFVVGSDAEMARAAAKLEGQPLDRPAASAIRIPAAVLLGRPAADDGGDPAERAVLDLLGEAVVSASADRARLTARGRLDLRD